MFLNWITAMVRNAVLKGFRQAVEELELEEDEAPEAIDFIKERMTALPPSAEVNGRAPRKTKASV